MSDGIHTPAPGAGDRNDTGTTKGGVFVVSLDFELHWGVRDHLSVAQYRENLLGARRVVPRLLDLFTRYGVHATWATVGALMLDAREELVRRLPPGANWGLSDVGESERDDVFHFAPSLVRLIAETPNQEIATHTFSHHYCLAPGQTADDFRRDLAAAVATAEEKLRRRVVSLVFPRNQVNEAYLPVCAELGIAAYRGTERAWIYRPSRNGALLRRALRLLDAYLDVSGPNVHTPVRTPGRPLDVPSSRFLRPYSPALGFLEPLRIRRITGAMAAAARSGRLFHLWWHPHNFGRNERQNLEVLGRVLDAFADLRRERGMRSLAMGEVAREYVEAHDA
jgi:peptidoglycan/xylan/chitin deacetylase (PgdA/CDA1 family)